MPKSAARERTARNTETKTSSPRALAVKGARHDATATRAAILDAAETVFIERGWHAAGMREVAERAGLAVSSIYNHFASKELLFEAVLTRQGLAVQTDALEGFVAATDFPGNVEAVVSLMRRLAKEHPVFVRLVIIDLVEFGARHVTTLAGVDLLPVIEALFRPNYERDASNGKLRDFDLPTVIRFLYLALFGYFAISDFYGAEDERPPIGGRVNPADEDREIARLIEHGILR